MEREKQNFSSGIPEYVCQKCQNGFFGWAESGICLDCGGNLELVKNAKILAFKEGKRILKNFKEGEKVEEGLPYP